MTDIVQQKPAYIGYDFFTYEVDFPLIAPAASQSASFTIQAEADFLLSKLTMTADIVGAAITDSSAPIPLCTLLIQDTGSGRQLSNVPVPLSNMFGSGKLPFILPRQRVFLARSVVNLTLLNFSAATTYNVKLSFVGEKAFRG